jgi:hypothetical protein
MKSKMKRILLDGNAVVLVNEDFINLQESETVWFENIDKLVKEVAEFLNSQGYVAEGNESPWISVKDRLPEVITYEDDSCNSVFVVWRVAPECGSKYSESSTVYLNKYPEKFLYWMPLPSAPESEE